MSAEQTSKTRSDSRLGSLKTIPLLVPELPTCEQIRPWLERIDVNRWYTNFGPLVQAFEEGIRPLLQSTTEERLAVAAVSNGTLGLELAISQLSLRAGSRVLVPSFTFPASACAIIRTGHVPVFADIDPQSFTLTPSIALDACDRLKIDAVMPVATLGMPVNSSEWDAFAVKTGLPVIVDAAGAIGNQTVGRRGVYVFSLHATKPFAVGEGGLVVSSDADCIRRVARLENFGFQGRRITAAVGTNAKMSEYHAAVGLAALELWEKKAKKLNAVLEDYRAHLGKSHKAVRLLPHTGEFVLSSLAVRIDRAAHGDIAAVQQTLETMGIQTRRWYYPPLHRQPVFRDLPQAGSLVVTNDVSQKSLGLPMHTYMTPTDVEYVTTSLKNLCGRLTG